MNHYSKRKINQHTNFDSSNIIIRNKKVLDSYINAASGFGGRYDPMTRLVYSASPLIDRATAELLYRQDWLSRKIVETIPDDATRKWIDIHTDENIVLDLQKKMKQLNTITKFKEALINARIYGGSAIILGMTNGTKPSVPLDYNNIDDVMYLNVIDNISLNVLSYYKNPFKEKYGLPEFYRLNTRLRPEKYDPEDYIIHESKLLIFQGAYLPEFLRRINKGWDDSILNAINQTLKQYGTSIQSGALLFQDFISKVLKMPNLSELLQSDEGIQALDKRIQYAIANLSSIGIVLLGENEEFAKMQTPITGLPELMDKYIEIVSAASSIPRSRLFGQSLGTLAGATETTRAYYDYVTAWQTDHLEKPVSEFIKILLNRKNSINKGIEPEQWSFKFNSLWEATDKELTTARKMQGQVDVMYIEKEVLTPEEVTISRFRPDGYSFDTIININKRIGKFWKESKPFDDNIVNDKFELPKSGNAPKEVRQILSSVYSYCRSRWVKEHPEDIDNKSNKESCAKIAWNAVKDAGWIKNKSGEWYKK
jgi:phage-related protein (TIGR01555 family)